MICSVRLLVFIMTLCACQQVHQRVSRAAELPNPRRDVKLCGGNNFKPKWICDPDSVLTDSDVNKFNKLLEDLRYNTTCACNQAECPSDGAGFTVTIAVKSTLPHRSGQVSAKNYAKYLRQHEWQYSACGDDVVVVFVNMSQQIGMSCGTTTVRELEYLVIEDILRNAERIFTTQNITQSIVFIIRSLKEAFNGDYKRTPPFPVWTVVHMALGSSFVLCCFLSVVDDRLGHKYWLLIASSRDDTFVNAPCLEAQVKSFVCMFHYSRDQINVTSGHVTIHWSENNVLSV